MLIMTLLLSAKSVTSLKSQAYCYCIHQTIATSGIQSGSTILTKHWGVKSVVEHFEGGLTRGYGDQWNDPNQGMHGTVLDTLHRHTDVTIHVFENICSLDNLSTIHFWFSPSYTSLYCSYSTYIEGLGKHRKPTESAKQIDSATWKGISLTHLKVPFL